MLYSTELNKKRHNTFIKESIACLTSTELNKKRLNTFKIKGKYFTSTLSDPLTSFIPSPPSIDYLIAHENKSLGTCFHGSKQKHTNDYEKHISSRECYFYHGTCANIYHIEQGSRT